MSDYKNSSYWRNYQKSLKKEKKAKKIKNYLIFFLVILAVTTILSFSINYYISFEPKKKTKVQTDNLLLSKKEIREIIKDKDESYLTKKYFTAKSNEKYLTFETTIEPRVQNYLESEINSSIHKGSGAPEIISIVIMEPSSGKIIGMKGFSSENSQGKLPSTGVLYPAASIFKIITAAAAVENSGYHPDKKIWFNGGKYTLYKRQLTNKKNKYSNFVKLKDAFAQSINPVFGKLGFFDLKKDVLTDYSLRFSFKKDLNSDINVAMSLIDISNEKYNWAEIACGFNNTTKISTLHAAVINSIIANGGNLAPPYLIKKVMDDQREVRYENKRPELVNAIKPSTSTAVAKMMERTVIRGTAKNSFTDYRRGKSMKSLIIGGKTGSISNLSNTIRFDWFTGFAKDKNTDKKIAFAIVIGHGKYLGTRAATYGRRLIANYFSNLS